MRYETRYVCVQVLLVGSVDDAQDLIFEWLHMAKYTLDSIYLSLQSSIALGWWHFQEDLITYL